MAFCGAWRALLVALALLTSFCLPAWGQLSGGGGGRQGGSENFTSFCNAQTTYPLPQLTTLGPWTFEIQDSDGAYSYPPHNSQCEDTMWGDEVFACWMAPYTGIATFTTCNPDDTSFSGLGALTSFRHQVISVHEGCSCAFTATQLPLACDEGSVTWPLSTNCDGAATIEELPVVGGEQYLVRLGVHEESDMPSRGELEISLRLASTGDECRTPTNFSGGASPLAAGEYNISWSDFTASKLTPPTGCGYFFFDAWFVATLDLSDTSGEAYNFDTCGSAVDTIIAVYDHSGAFDPNIDCLKSKLELNLAPGCSDDEPRCGTAAQVSINPVGTDFLVRIGLYSGDPDLVPEAIPVRVTRGAWVPPDGRAPKNDECVDSTDISEFGNIPFDTRGAMTDIAVGCGNNTVFFCYEAPATGKVYFNPCISLSLDPVGPVTFAIVSGTDCDCASSIPPPSSPSFECMQCHEPTTLNPFNETAYLDGSGGFFDVVEGERVLVIVGSDLSGVATSPAASTGYIQFFPASLNFECTAAEDLVLVQNNSGEYRAQGYFNLYPYHSVEDFLTSGAAPVRYFEMVAPVDGDYTFSACGFGDTAISVYQYDNASSTCSSLLSGTALASSDDSDECVSEDQPLGASNSDLLKGSVVQLHLSNASNYLIVVELGAEAELEYLAYGGPSDYPDDSPQGYLTVTANEFLGGPCRKRAVEILDRGFSSVEFDCSACTAGNVGVVFGESHAGYSAQSSICGAALHAGESLSSVVRLFTGEALPLFSGSLSQGILSQWSDAAEATFFFSNASRDAAVSSNCTVHRTSISGPVSFAWGSPVNLSAVLVPPFSGLVREVTVVVRANVSSVQALSLTLDMNGTVIPLAIAGSHFDASLRPGSARSLANEVNVRFSDRAEEMANTASYTIPSPAIFKPTGRLSLLTGADPSGEWTLMARAVDDGTYGGATANGVILEFGLEVKTCEDTCGDLVCGPTENEILCPTDCALRMLPRRFDEEGTCLRETTDGASFLCWGNNQYGQLLLGDTDSVHDLGTVLPLKLSTAEFSIKELVCSSEGCLSLTELEFSALPESLRQTFTSTFVDGGSLTSTKVNVLHAWGRWEVPGIESWGAALAESYLEVPVITSEDALFDPPDKIDGYYRHWCLVTKRGKVNCFGSNSHGQIGIGWVGGLTTWSYDEPALLNCMDVAVGYDHTCALQRDGAVRCWGAPEGAGLGDRSQGAASSSRAQPPLPLGARAIQIAAGTSISCALLENGCVKCWGSNTAGRLGQGLHASAVLGGANFSSIPCINLGEVGVGADNATNASQVRATRIVVGREHVCVLFSPADTGGVKCFGDNSLGQLGIEAVRRGENSAEMSALSFVQLGRGLRALEITAGADHTCALLQNADNKSKYKCWGSNSDGQLGIVGGSESLGTKDFQMGNNLLSVAFDPVSVEHMDVSENHACAVIRVSSSEFRVKCWGNNNEGQCGTEEKHGQTPFSTGSYLPAVPGLTAEYDAIALGSGFTCVATDSASTIPSSPQHGPVAVTCFGTNAEGQLGRSINVSSVAAQDATRSEIGYYEKIGQMCAGRDYVCMTVAQNKSKPQQLGVICWGSNQYGQTGSPIRTLPPPFHVFSKGVVDLACGDHHACVVLSDGTARCWGRAHSGRLGYSSNQPWIGYIDPTEQEDVEHIGDDYSDPNITQLAPVDPGRVAGVIGISRIGCGGKHTCAILTNEKVVCWGANDVGQLGLDVDDQVLFAKSLSRKTDSFVEINGFIRNLNAVSLSVGEDHTCVIQKNTNNLGLLTCWGSNKVGQLGISNRQVISGTTVESARTVYGSDASTLADLPGSIWLPGGGTSELSSSGNTTCAKTKSKGMVCWGAGSSGQLGRGTRTDSFLAAERSSLVRLDSCPVGTGVTGSTFGCTTCPTGTFAAPGSTCDPCPAGFFADDSGQLSCLPCPRGTYAELPGMSACVSCKPGTYVNQTGATGCLSCQIGHYAKLPGSTSCLPCPFGQKADQIGSILCSRCGKTEFADSTGSSACQTCPTGSTSEASEGRSCQCGENTFKTKKSECDTCPLGAICSAGSLSGNDAGFWRSEDDIEVIYKCPFPQACLEAIESEDRCLDGHRGPVCAVCEEGYYMGIGQTCQKCADQANWLWFLIGGLIFLAALVALSVKFFIDLGNEIQPEDEDGTGQMATRDDDGAGTENVQVGGGGGGGGAGGPGFKQLFDVSKVRVLVGFLQVFTALGTTYDVPWPGSFIEFMDSFSFISLDVLELTGTACLSGSPEETFYLGFIVMFLAPFAIVALLALILFALFGFYKVKFRDDKYVLNRLSITLPINKLVHWTFVVLFLVYPGVSYKMLAVLYCSESVDGTSYLVADYTIVCWEGNHVGYAIMGIIGVIIYPIGIPAATAYILWSRRRVIQHDLVFHAVEDKRFHREERRKLQDEAREHLYDVLANMKGGPNLFYMGHQDLHKFQIDDEKFETLMHDLGATNGATLDTVRFFDSLRPSKAKSYGPIFVNSGENMAGVAGAMSRMGGGSPFLNGVGQRGSVTMKQIERWWLSPEADHYRHNQDHLFKLSDNVPLRFLVDMAYDVMSTARAFRGAKTEVIEYIDSRKIEPHSSRDLVRQRFGSVYENYVARGYIWEVVDMTRKMILVGAMIFVPRGSVLQIGLAMLVCWVALCVHIYVRPYLDRSTDVFMALALTVLALTLFAGLLLKSAESDSGGSDFENDILSAFLIVINAAVLLLAVVLITMKVFEVARAVRQYRTMIASSKETDDGKIGADPKHNCDSDDSDSDEEVDLYHEVRLLESGKATVNAYGEVELHDIPLRDLEEGSFASSATTDSEHDRGNTSEGSEYAEIHLKRVDSVSDRA